MAIAPPSYVFRQKVCAAGLLCTPKRLWMQERVFFFLFEPWIEKVQNESEKQPHITSSSTDASEHKWQRLEKRHRQHFHKKPRWLLAPALPKNTFLLRRLYFFLYFWHACSLPQRFASNELTHAADERAFQCHCSPTKIRCLWRIANSPGSVCKHVRAGVSLKLTKSN